MWHKNITYNRGFTLIELLVVLTIIAILSTISTIYYVGLESKARDSSRRASVIEISTALEVNKTQASYRPLQASQFTSFTPVDPRGVPYCIAPSALPDPSATIWGHTCPVGFEAVAAGVPSVGNFQAFKVCTYLESPADGQPNVYCRTGSL